MPFKKKGLRVKWCEKVASYHYSTGWTQKLKLVVQDGWRIQVYRCGKWVAIMDLLFSREKDAVRAAHALTVAGLDSITALEKADQIMVKQVATEFLQW